MCVNGVRDQRSASLDVQHCVYVNSAVFPALLPVDESDRGHAWEADPWIRTIVDNLQPAYGPCPVYCT